MNTNLSFLRGWILLWAALIMLPTILSPFSLMPICIMGIFVTFLAYWGYRELCPAVDWESPFDWGMAYVAVSFLGSMMAFLIPCLYEFDIMCKWSTWCEVMIMAWLFTIVVGGQNLYRHESLKQHKMLLLGVTVLALIAFLIGLITIL